MNIGRIGNAIGLALLAACFLWAAGRVVLRTRAEADPNEVVIRFAHWQLEGGIREAFDALARRYMELNPGVRVEQMLIPERVYPNWLITQLVGGTAPDLIEVRAGMPEDRIARYFLPLRRVIDEPNPYNAGTPLEGLPWRDTFIDGLASPPAYIADLLDYYAIPTAMFTVRLYYNVELYRRVAGDRPLPRTFDELVELCEAVREYASARGEPIIPIAGSMYNAPPLIFALFGSQTQRLTLELCRDYRMALNPDRVWMAYLRGDWNHRTPAVHSGLRMMRALGRHMQPGFLSLRREDATFYFVQGRALMIASGSWDILSMHEQAPFPIDAFAIPMPERDHPLYGQYTLGRVSEAGQPASCAFSIARSTRHPEQALDFLRFLASRPGNQLFSDISNWLPAIIGVTPPERLRPFALAMEGYIAGFQPVYGADSRRVFNNYLHELVAPEGSPERYADAVDARMPAAVLQDLRLALARRERQWRRNDSVLAATAMLAGGTDDPRLAELLEAVVDHQAATCWMRSELEAITARRRL